MGQRLPPDEAALYRAVSDALLHDWDPIGVSDIPEAQDEYYSYLPQIYRLIWEEAGADAIGDYLHRIETEAMGLSTERDRIRPVAERLASLRAQHLDTSSS